MRDCLEPELTRFEGELRKVKAAPVPESFRNRLLSQRPMARLALNSPVARENSTFPWRQLLKWLIPAAAVGVVILVALPRHPAGPAIDRMSQGVVTSEPTQPVSRLGQTLHPALEAEELEIGQTWVATFDAVAELPSGEPVRFRCREWTDTTVFRDRTRGLIVERSTPRLEVVPVRFETY
jgi:hypothetical protein